MQEQQLQPYQPQHQAPYREERTVDLTPQQIAILTAPIPPHDLDITADGKMHIPFAAIQARFNAAFGWLKWRLEPTTGRGQNPVIRPEEVNGKGTKYEVVLSCDLIVQGITVCTVTDSAVYFSWNSDGSYANAVESARAKCHYEAAKALGIGGEIKDRRYVEFWKKNYAESSLDGGRTKWRKRTGESPTQQQIHRLFEVINGDTVLLYQTLPQLVNRLLTAAEMEAMIGRLSARRAERRASPVGQSFISRWETSGATSEEISDAMLCSTTEAENRLWELCAARKPPAASESPAGFQSQPAPEEPSESDGIPDDAPGLGNTAKGPWCSYASAALEKWYGDKAGDEKMRLRYHSAMAIKACRAGGGEYQALMNMEFYEVVRIYNASKEGK
jgi:hypothetical protein